MSQTPFKKGFPWLIIGVSLFLVSFLLYLYDQGRSDEDILNHVQHALQEDFDNCLRYYKLDIADRTELPSPDCIACELVYNAPGELISWSNNEYLPPQANVNRLRNFGSEGVLELDNRLYFQTRQYTEAGVRVVLIPLRITYNINNNFLLPFVFFGRWQEWITEPDSWRYFNPFSTQEIKRLRVGTQDIPGIKIYLEGGELLFAIYGLEIDNFRFFSRALVLILFVLGLLVLFVYFRIYAINHWGLRYYINGILFLGVILFRIALYINGLPGSYIDIGLFSPEILAFNDIFAPSLGELSINIVTLAILVWVLYVHFFRLLNLWYRKIIVHKKWAWPFAIFALMLSSYLLACFFDLFYEILDNSQVEIEFSNLFGTSAYSFLILLDIGILLLAILLVISSLLKFNIFFGLREGFSPFFVLVHILVLLGTNLFLHPNGDWPFAFIAICGLFLVFATILRLPFEPMLHYDPVNYFLLVLCCSLIVTYSVIVGLDIQQQNKVERIVDRILGSQVGKTALAYETSLGNIDNDIDKIKKKYNDFRKANSSSEFVTWLKETYLDPNFPQFDIWVFLYDTNGERLDKLKSRVPSFGPEADSAVASRAESVQTFANLYQLPNYENKYIDLYVGEFALEFQTDTIKCILELSPTRLETEGLYPSLSLDQDLYEDIRLINSFDHAVYRENILYSEKGNTPFPIYLEEDQQFEEGTPHKWVDEDNEAYLEIKENLQNGKVVVVRYQSHGLVQILTSFSFVFYFYTLAGLILIILPVFVLRWMKVRSFSYHMPIRTKIRLGLIGISIIPMFVIIGFIGPFINGRYNREAKEELQEEAARIANAVGQKYVKMHGDVFGRVTLRQEFANEIRELEPIVRNDINIYNDLGHRIASTQPLIYERGLTSDLMEAKAYVKLKDGELSDMVIDEKVGRLSYFSAYRPIVGVGRTPIGYVNVPYIARQDQISQQVQNFLSYLLNIYLLVFVGINFFAVLLSNTFTKPLSLIQQRLADTTLGNVNKPIDYESKDEIGAIVTAYNQMVEELDFSERKLKQSQRELAWRQMARQVAHEIKNPLTPMRLSLQHLNRTWQEQPTKLEKMFPRVMNTLMIQIDSLVRIANSFHEFAKMPEPKRERVLINDVLLEVVDLYAQSEEATWLVDIPEEEFYGFIDRDQLSRCFNNIIKNGLQAIDTDGAINISMKIKNRHSFIYIKDNGKGMDLETQKRVFEPNFSTKNSGMGLGLAIVKRIIESNGGSIDFESEEGVGTTFCIEMPSIDLVV